MENREHFQRVVIKLGTNVLTDDTGALDRAHLSHLVEEVVRLKARGVEVLLVSSGAVTAGRASLSETDHLNKVLRRQMLSAVGQARLMHLYQVLFGAHDRHVAQVLATKEDFRDRRHYLNMKHCLQGLLRDEIIPILNENDVVAVTELMFTDNDELAGLVAAMINAEALIILSSVEGVLNGPPELPNSRVISEIDPFDTAVQQLIFPARSSFGRGGMHTKLRVARRAAKVGISTIIANGKEPQVITRILSGASVGTRFRPKKVLSNVKKWLAHQENRKGEVHVNAGAAAALQKEDRVSSLLPVGVTRIKGEFEKGDIVTILHDGASIGMGMAQYSSRTARKYLGRRGKRPLIHYDYMLIDLDY